ncbi:MAG: hypothetical protein N3J91_13920 [Verrucomicrobiae bacterium]|nr:hypothetical protein [Verrucomicrobiae bacterium]
MANGIKTRPVRRMTQAKLDAFLEKAADILCANIDHSEFRGQPEQTKSEDGRNQKTDAEYVIREGLVKSDLSQTFVPWGAFFNLEKRHHLIPENEAALVGEFKAERPADLKDIHDAYAPVLKSRLELEAELARLEAADFNDWLAAPNLEKVCFGTLTPLADELRKLETHMEKVSGEEKRETGERPQASRAKLQAQTPALKGGGVEPPTPLFKPTAANSPPVLPWNQSRRQPPAQQSSLAACWRCQLKPGQWNLFSLEVLTSPAQAEDVKIEVKVKARHKEAQIFYRLNTALKKPGISQIVKWK